MSFDIDLELSQDVIVCGVDEAGRGPLFGDVVAAAVILDPLKPIAGLGDSKKISEKNRDHLYQEILLNAKSVGVGRASVEEIDELNILHATMLAMKRAVQKLTITPTLALIDGNRCPDLACKSQALEKHGISPQHRRSFGPVRRLIGI